VTGAVTPVQGGWAEVGPVAPPGSGRVPCLVRFRSRGPVAQLGARLNGIQEVTGSIPVRSTISKSLILSD
jgi:hypothetical protein